MPVPIAPFPRLRYRRTGEGGVAFDEQTWETHIFNPAATAVYEAIVDEFGSLPTTTAGAVSLLEAQLGLDPNTQVARELLSMFRRMGIVV